MHCVVTSNRIVGESSLSPNTIVTSTHQAQQLGLFQSEIIMVNIVVLLPSLSFVSTSCLYSGIRTVTRRKGSTRRFLASVTGPVYTATDADAPLVRLFTKEGCSLCDTVKDVLQEIRQEHPHSLTAVDITDSEHSMYWDRYKYDIPVLHMDQLYWTKHRITREQAIEGLIAFKSGSFESPRGEPDAAKYERE